MMDRLFKTYFFPLATLALLAVPFVACSFENRSDAYLCPTGNECEPGRVCADGWCVLSTGSDIDADLTPTPDAAADAMPGAPDADPPDADPPDAAPCPDECSSCMAGICIIDCLGTGDCTEQVACPAGLVCRVNCDGAGSCSGGVDCTNASSCQITCSGTSSCAEAVVCGAGVCSIACTGATSCAAGLDCSQSCQCDTSCPLGGCGTHTCPAPNPCTSGGVCTSGPGPCQTCTP